MTGVCVSLKPQNIEDITAIIALYRPGPQAIYMFYAVNLVGGIANMIHPLSAEKEIEFYLNASESTTAITLDQFYNKFEHIRQNTHIININIASVST